MIDRLLGLQHRYKQLSDEIGIPEVVKDTKRYLAMTRELASLAEIVGKFDQFTSLEADLANTQAMIEEADPEMREMAKEELKEIQAKHSQLEQDLHYLLIPKDPLDNKSIIMEIRAGTGGDEAGLFAADLYRMYSRYCELKGWKTDVMSASQSELGGIKEIVFSISGNNVYGTLKFESGGHRVQRVPETENSGRIHTSACTVAVLPEAEETDIVINDNDLRIDSYRSGGPGGQSVNTTDSAVRITHLPSGLVVICQDEKSQLKNKAKAMRVLKARLFELEEGKRLAEISATRKTQIGSGDRSERIRTYNFPQNRLTDHRINLTLYHLDKIIEGELDQVIEPLLISHREEALKESL